MIGQSGARMKDVWKPVNIESLDFHTPNFYNSAILNRSLIWCSLSCGCEARLAVLLCLYALYTAQLQIHLHSPDVKEWRWLQALYTRSILWVFGWPPSLWIKQSSFTVGGWLPVCWFVADLFLFLIFQMSAISCVFGLQLWNLAGWNLVRLFVSCFIHMRNSRQHFLNVEPTAQRSLFPKNVKPWPNGLASRSK